MSFYPEIPMTLVKVNVQDGDKSIIDVHLGSDTDNISTITVSFSLSSDLSDEEKKPLMVELKEKLMALPQVEDVSQAMPRFPRFIDGRFVSQVIEAKKESLVVSTRTVEHRYFQVLNYLLIDGDFFTAAVVKDENRLMDLNDVFAARLADGEGSAVGSKIKIGDDLYTVAGVVKGGKCQPRLRSQCVSTL